MIRPSFFAFRGSAAALNSRNWISLSVSLRDREGATVEMAIGNVSSHKLEDSGTSNKYLLFYGPGQKDHYCQKECAARSLATIIIIVIISGLTLTRLLTLSPSLSVLVPCEKGVRIKIIATPLLSDNEA